MPLSLHVRRAGQATRVWEGREKAVATTPPWRLLPDVRRGLRLSSAASAAGPLRGPDFIDSVKGSRMHCPVVSQTTDQIYVPLQTVEHLLMMKGART